MLNPKYSRLAVAGTCTLIIFLSYISQIFVLSLDTRQTYIFNTLIACIWLTYARCIFTDPGTTPAGWTPSWQKNDDDIFNGGEEDEEEDAEEESEGAAEDTKLEKMKKKDEDVREQSGPDKRGRIWGNADCRWCKKCRRWKPARAHHCKTCQKCILLMDHHCPWTMNCVGYRNWPHFLRFLSYVVVTTGYLQKLLLVKCWEVYESRNLPAYLGPTLSQLILLAFLLIFNTITLFAIFVLWARIITNIFEGYTTIEWWEQERHGSLVRRKVVRRQLFPYDVSLYSNLCLFMGGGILFWWFPLAPNRRVGENESDGGGLKYQVSDFEKSWKVWPPPDPEKFGIAERPHFNKEMEAGPWTKGEYNVNDVHAFRQRQREDLKRFNRVVEGGSAVGPDEEEDREMDREDMFDEYVEVGYPTRPFEEERRPRKYEPPKKKWRNDEGDTLEDYGVDEDADTIDDDDSIPLAELMRRQREREALRANLGKAL